MVSHDLRRLTIWVVAVVLVMGVCQCDLVKIKGWHDYNVIMQKKEHYVPQVSQAEIDGFIKLWPQFNELKLENVGGRSLSVEPEEMSWKTKVWFLYHQWDAERFFYVRQRLLDLLQSIAVKRHVAAVVADLSTRDDELSQEMVAEHKRLLAAETLDEEEMQRVAAKEAILKKLFKSYP